MFGAHSAHDRSRRIPASETISHIVASVVRVQRSRKSSTASTSPYASSSLTRPSDRAVHRRGSRQARRRVTWSRPARRRCSARLRRAPAATIGGSPARSDPRIAGDALAREAGRSERWTPSSGRAEEAASARSARCRRAGVGDGTRWGLGWGRPRGSFWFWLTGAWGSGGWVRLFGGVTPPFLAFVVGAGSLATGLGGRSGHWAPDGGGQWDTTKGALLLVDMPGDKSRSDTRGASEAAAVQHLLAHTGKDDSHRSTFAHVGAANCGCAAGPYTVASAR